MRVSGFLPYGDMDTKHLGSGYEIHSPISSWRLNDSGLCQLDRKLHTLKENVDLFFRRFRNITGGETSHEIFGELDQLLKMVTLMQELWFTDYWRLFVYVQREYIRLSANVEQAEKQLKTTEWLQRTSRRAHMNRMLEG